MMRFLWREVKDKFRDDVVVCGSQTLNKSQVSFPIDHHKGCCRPEQLSSVGNPPHWRPASRDFPDGRRCLGEMYASVGELKLYIANRKGYVVVTASPDWCPCNSQCLHAVTRRPTRAFGHPTRWAVVVISPYSGPQRNPRPGL